MKFNWKTFLFYTSIIIFGGSFIFVLVKTVQAKNTGFETKTLWDWMDLFIIPLVLAIGAFFLNRSERITEREIATDRQQEAVLQFYLDRMAELLLKEKLRTTKNKEVGDLARTWTLTVLRGLDAKRKGLVLRFIKEAGLINKEKPILNMRDADFSYANLMGINLSNANLSGVAFSHADLWTANLTGTNLSSAYLWYADLADTNLSGANLSDAFLINTKLSLANLSLADLSRAYLQGADLEHVNLTNAKVTNEQLAQAKSLKGATMPDGTTYK